MRLVLGLFAALLLLVSCKKDAPEGGYKVTHHIDKGGKKPQIGEYVYCQAYQRIAGEVKGSTRESGELFRFKIPELKKDGIGVLPEVAGARLMSIGDSLTVFIPVDSVKNKPEQYKDLKFIELDLVLVDIKTEAEFNADRDKAEGEAMEKMKTNKAKNEQFLVDNKAKAGVKTTASGLQYEVMTEGTGAKPKKSDVVKVHYVGTLIDGKEFDSSYKRNEPAEFPLANVIPGWTEGLQLMKIGSKYKFTIPAALAYGEQSPSPNIPPSSTLQFVVELLSAKPAPPKGKGMPEMMPEK